LSTGGDFKVTTKARVYASVSGTIIDLQSSQIAHQLQQFCAKRSALWWRFVALSTSDRTFERHLGRQTSFKYNCLYYEHNVTLHYPSSSHCTHVKGQVYFVKYGRVHATPSSDFTAPLATAMPYSWLLSQWQVAGPLHAEAILMLRH
jgi:hypothetical protein